MLRLGYDLALVHDLTWSWFMTESGGSGVVHGAWNASIQGRMGGLRAHGGRSRLQRLLSHTHARISSASASSETKLSSSHFTRGGRGSSLDSVSSVVRWAA